MEGFGREQHFCSALSDCTPLVCAAWLRLISKPLPAADSIQQLQNGIAHYARILLIEHQSTMICALHGDMTAVFGKCCQICLIIIPFVAQVNAAAEDH